RDRQPRLAGRKAAQRVGMLPNHRRAATVPSLETRPKAYAVRIAQVLEGEVRLLQPQFLALIEADRTTQAGQKRDGELCDGCRVVALSRPARDVADHIVIGERPANPTVRCSILKGLYALANVVWR